MNTAIVYATRHGAAEKVAHRLKTAIGEQEVQLIDLGKGEKCNPGAFAQIIIGGSIHAGNIQKKVTEFCRRNLATLLQKRVGLFLCCMNEPDFQPQFDRAFPEALRAHAVSRKIMGGEFLLERMNFLERMIVKKIARIHESMSKIDDDNIQEMADDLRNI